LCAGNPLPNPVKHGQPFKNACESLIMQYYHPILHSVFLSACFWSISTGFVFIFEVDAPQFLSELCQMLFFTQKLRIISFKNKHKTCAD